MIPFPATVIGLMSGTSADGVDAAILRTDGRAIAQAGESLFVPYEAALRSDILALMRGQGDAVAVAQSITDVHIQAVKQLIKKANVSRETLALVGFHGQTIRHAPAEGITEQIGEPARMAAALGIPVVADFRSNDVRHGGQGAPLVPLYHAALAQALPKPLLVVNIGGVANVTWIGEGVTRVESRESSEAEFAAEPRKKSPRSVDIGTSTTRLSTLDSGHSLLAFDCGPGNALLDDWMFAHTGQRFDANGATASRGAVDTALVEAFLQDPFFAEPAPKSLDRLHFEARVKALLATRSFSLEDGAAALTAMSARAIGHALMAVPAPPRQLLIAGGGRHNPCLMAQLAACVEVPVVSVEQVGWDGDMLEAQAFAYLAARSVQGLPLSLPTTTGVKMPVTGGVLYDRNGYKKSPAE
jgi:anhydro-N-acetylmuramic acid kinase